MLTLDFINVGNGDSILVRELREGAQRFAMLVDCGHDNLIRDDHPMPLDPRSRRIYAGDFLKQLGVTHLDVLLLTHFHRDHVGRPGPGAGGGNCICCLLQPESTKPDSFSDFGQTRNKSLRNNDSSANSDSVNYRPDRNKHFEV